MGKKKGSKKSIVAASKQAERAVAERFGGRRLSAGEWQGKGDIDVVHPTYAIQVKQRSGVAAYILEGMQQAQEAAEDAEELARLLGVGESRCNPEPVLVIVTKPGSGHASRMFKVTEVFKDE